jgi:hypothetical protein
LASQLNASPFLAYNAACVNARSSVVVRQDAKLSKSEREHRAEQYAERAMGWLRKARAAGYFKGAAAMEALKSEDDLAPLRDRDDLKKWLDELGKSPA